MDEPLSNLDAKLRVQMRTVIKKLQRRLGITTIYVTHDQEEALAISARPEQLSFGDEGLPGKILFSTFLGDFIEYEIETESGQVLQLNEYTKDTTRIRPDGEAVHIRFDPERVGVYDENGELLTVWGN